MSMEFGGIFRALRQKKGWSQEEMADKIFMSQSDISKFENDHMLPDVPTFIRIAQVTQAPEIVIAFLYGMDGISILQNLTQLIGGFILWM